MFTILQLSLMFTTPGYCWYLNQHRQVEASAIWKQLCLIFTDIFLHIFFFTLRELHLSFIATTTIKIQIHGHL